MTNFSCSVTCQGIYADVEKVAELATDTLEKEQHATKSAPTIFGNLILAEMAKLRAFVGREGNRKDKGKVSRLMKQYNDFKKQNLPNFRFNPEKGMQQFGKQQKLCSFEIII